MLIIDNNKLVSLSVVEEHFVCQLDACKGACCWEGDSGAPVAADELYILDELADKIRPFLTTEGALSLAMQGNYVYNEETEEYATPLINDRDCAYLTYESNGIAKCGIERAYEAGVIDFKKPISCHLYPIRVQEMSNGYEALNYDVWNICASACTAGKSLQVPVYKFLESALVRKYGQDFYDELDAAAQHYLSDTKHEE
jgi:hypothetical protein